MRTFVALEAAPETLEAWARLGDELRAVSRLRSAAWIPHDRYHITLAFLGATAAADIEPLAEGLRSLAASSAAFAVGFQGLTAFPTPARGRVLVALLDVGHALGALQKSVADLVTGRGYRLEERPFRPHLTFARMRDAADFRAYLGAPEVTAALPKVAPESPLRWSLDALTLFESKPSATGALYTPVVRYPLPA